MADAYGSFAPSYVLAAVVALLGAAAALFIPRSAGQRALAVCDTV